MLHDAANHGGDQDRQTARARCQRRLNGKADAIMSAPFTSPEWRLDAFNCPHCGVYALQQHCGRDMTLHNPYADESMNVVRTTICPHCKEFAIWHLDTMLYPDRGTAPLPNSDMPDEVLSLYEEAAMVASKSPRSAAALLRLAVQHLCTHLGQEGKNINHDIGELVKEGLNPTVQKALDVVRVVGNNAVHPGTIDTDDSPFVGKMFDLVNFIVQQMITNPKQIESIYQDEVPEGVKEAIERRDG